MTYRQFLRQLFEHGRVTVPGVEPLQESELAEGDREIAEYERLDRLNFPGAAPEFDADAARWAAERFFRACQFAVYRDIDAGAIQQELEQRWRGADSPSTHYSVDLLFRFLPDLTKFAASAAEKDPLVDALRDLARDWPFSSVGMEGIEDVRVDGFSDFPGMMQLYVDRIIAAKDNTRLSSPLVRDHVRATLGLFPELAPNINAALSHYEERESSV